MKYDVIIVGAGPAGLRCAEELKNSDLSVLLIEKNKIIGPKVCGGGLTALIKTSDIPINKTRSFIKQQTFLADNKYEITLVNPVKTVDRFDLGQYQLRKIKKANNITILNGTTVRSIKKNKVITDKNTFYFRYLIGADGSTSTVRKHLGLKSKLCIGITYHIPKITDEFIWYFNPKLLKSGYIWAFPHKTYTSVGIYFNPKYLKPTKAREILKQYLVDNGYKFSDNKFRASPVNFQYDGCIFDNIFVIGDAAGLASKIWGEGIPHALTSGMEIGKKILNPGHNLTELDKTIKIKRRQEKISFLFDAFPYFQTFFIKLFVKLMMGSWFQYYFGIAIPKVKERPMISITKDIKELSTLFPARNKWIRMG